MKLQVDLRHLPGEAFTKAARALPSYSIMMTAWQWAFWKQQGGDEGLGRRAVVMAPDFLHYARLAGTGQPKEILKLPGASKPVVLAAMACVPSGVRLLPGLATGQFWAAAKAMTRYDVALLGSGFSGEVVLHYNLADFACFFDRADMITFFKNAVGTDRPWGLATQQVSAMLSLCSRNGLFPERLVFPTGVSRPEQYVLYTAGARQFAAMKTTVDLTQWPTEMLSAADLYDFARQEDDTWLVSVDTAIELS